MNQLLNNYTLLNVLRVFFDDPSRDFQLREISRRINLAHKSVLIYLNNLVKSGLVKVNTKTLYKSYNANTENPMFQRYKRAINQIQIYESGIVDYLYEKLMPNTLVLFGSFAKGTDGKTSDIDIFIEAKEEKIGVTEFEKALGRKIHLIFEEDIKNLSNELKNNIINGIVLSGNLRLFK